MLFYTIVDKKGEPYTYGGRVLLHEDKAEIAFLFPKSRVVQYKPGPGDVAMMLRDHPDLSAIRFPLNKADFIRRQVRR